MENWLTHGTHRDMREKVEMENCNKHCASKRFVPNCFVYLLDITNQADSTLAGRQGSETPFHLLLTLFKVAVFLGKSGLSPH